MSENKATEAQELSAEDIYKQYTDCMQFDNDISFYDEVKENRNYFIGNQWEGANVGNLTKVVVNIVGLIGRHHVAQIQTNDISSNITAFHTSDEEMALKVKVLNNELDKQIELSRIKEKVRSMIEDSYTDGNTCIYLYTTIDEKSKELYKADIQAEVLDSTQVLFGNPYNPSIQSQPFVIVVQRLYLEDVKLMCRNNGVSEDVINGLAADDDESRMNESTALNVLKTVITRFYKVKGSDGYSVHYTKSCKETIIVEDTDLEISMYPLVYSQWQLRNKYNYRGVSPITYVKPNQQMINKILSLMLFYSQNMAFPYALADSTKLKRIINTIFTDSNGQKVITTPNIDMTGKVLDFMKAPDFSQQVNNTLQMIIDLTKECMGISDANIGNVRPENTSAIIALQDSTMVPLQTQIRAFNDVYEQVARIMVELMSVDYGSRDVEVIQNGEISVQSFNFNDLKDANLNIRVDVGQSQYWSELTQIQTLDNLLARQVITNPIDYLERIPSKYISNKQELINSLKMAQQQAMSSVGPQVEANAQMEGDYATAEALAQMANQGQQISTEVQA